MFCGILFRGHIESFFKTFWKIRSIGLMWDLWTRGQFMYIRPRLTYNHIVCPPQKRDALLNCAFSSPSTTASWLITCYDTDDIFRSRGGGVIFSQGENKFCSALRALFSWRRCVKRMQNYVLSPHTNAHFVGCDLQRVAHTHGELLAIQNGPA